VKRALFWLAALACSLAGAWSGDANVSAVAAALILIGLWTTAPPSLHPALGTIAICSVLARWLGDRWLPIDLMPAWIAAFVGWIFARTLLAGRQPLIARAIAAIDGDDQLEQLEVVRYARGLTVLWASVQAALFVLGVACALNARGAWLPFALPSSRVFSGLILPGVVVSTFVLEFVLRRVLLPSAPRHHLLAFLRRLVGSWPRLLE